MFKKYELYIQSLFSINIDRQKNGLTAIRPYTFAEFRINYKRQKQLIAISAKQITINAVINAEAKDENI